MRGPRTPGGRALRRMASLLTLAAFSASLALGGHSSARAQETTTFRASIATDGLDPNGPSGAPLLSANGNVVVYQSSASDLTGGDENGLDDVFAYDRTTGSVTMVSAASDSGPANGPSTPLGVSSDGRYVVFSSSASNLTADPLPQGCEPARGCNAEIFLRDLQAGTTELVSRSVDGQAANLPSGAAAVSDDGRYVAFVSFATNLVVADTNSAADVFLRDRVANTLRRVDVATPGTQANGACDPQVLAMTPDASVIAFSTTASNLGPRDTAGTWDVYLRDRAAAVTRRISQRPDGRPAFGRSLFPSLSADGSTVAFMSMAQLANGDSPNTWDIYVRSRATGQLTRIPLSTTGVPRLSADGGHVAFPSADSGLGRVPKGSTQAVVWNLETRRFRIASLDGDTPSNGTVTIVSPSSDGGVAAFDTTAADILPVDRNGGVDIIVQLLDPPSA